MRHGVDPKAARQRQANLPHYMQSTGEDQEGQSRPNPNPNPLDLDPDLTVSRHMPIGVSTHIPTKEELHEFDQSGEYPYPQDRDRDRDRDILYDAHATLPHHSTADPNSLAARFHHPHAEHPDVSPIYDDINDRDRDYGNSHLLSEDYETEQERKKEYLFRDVHTHDTKFGLNNETRSTMNFRSHENDVHKHKYEQQYKGHEELHDHLRVPTRRYVCLELWLFL